MAAVKAIDVNALIMLKHARHQLSGQQYKTLRGQVLAGDAAGALRGLKKLTKQAGEPNADNT